MPRGLSPELAEQFPHLRVMYLCGGAAAVCDLKDKTVDGGNCTAVEGCSIRSLPAQNPYQGREVVKFFHGNPTPCDQCEYFQTRSDISS